jgi:hypothetical protein
MARAHRSEGRRVRAAVAYSGLTSSEILNRLKGAPQRSTTTLDRWKREGFASTETPATIERFAEICDLPVAFFYADFNRLAEITAPAPGEGVPGLADVHERSAAKPAQTDGRHRRDQPPGAAETGSGAR